MIDWPLNSSNINLSVILWLILKHHVMELQPYLNELDWFLHEEWDKIDLAILKHYIL